MKAINKSSHKELAHKLDVAGSAFSRMKGLLGRQSLPPGEGLLIKPCKGIHTFFMSFPIDVVFLDKDNIVIGTHESLQPHRITKVMLSAISVIELPAGTILATNTIVNSEIVID